MTQQYPPPQPPQPPPAQYPPPQYPQQPYPQQPYQQAPPPQPYPAYPYSGHQPDGRIVSVGEWMLNTLVMMIPFVNLIMMFVWAFSNDGSQTKSNFYKAALIWAAIGIGIWVIIGIIVAASGASLFDNF